MLKNVFQGHARFGVCALLLAAFAGQNSARADDTKWDHFGRWTVDDPTDKFSANGMLYRVVDIAPCGKDFCGVSVTGGACGATLFRFFSTHGKDDALQGHGKWGPDQKKLYVLAGSDTPTLNISMGDPRFDPESRSGSSPTFTADYHRIGDAQCKADAPGT